MTRRRAPATTASATPNPFDAAQLADMEGLAAQLAAAMNAVKDFDAGSIKGNIYSKPSATGPWQYCDVIYPPFENFTEVMEDLRDRFGGGDYELRVTAGGSIRKNVPFTIAREKARPLGQAPAAAAAPDRFGELIVLMMNNQQAAADRQMNMMIEGQKSQASLLAAVLPALAGGGAGKGASAADTVALITALQDRKGGGGGLKETIEAMVAMKQLLGDQGGEGERPGGFDPDDLVASGARLIGPVAAALGDYVSRMRGGGEGGGSSASLASPPSGGDQLALGSPPSRFRIIELVRVDVTYMFERGHDPGKAADLVYDVIQANHVTEEEINDLAARFALSPTGLDDLAAEGIDLRARPGWAAEFFSELGAIHSGETGDLDRGDGGEADPAGDGAPSAARAS